MKAASTIAIAVAASILVGCGQRSIVGTWTSKVDVEPLSGTGETTFRADGTCYSTVRFNSPSGVVIIGKDRGTWKLGDKGETLTVTISEMTFDFEGGSPEQAARAKVQMQALTPTLLKTANEAAKNMALAWKSADEFTLAAQGRETVYKRKP